jgi:hypothetical protein
MSKDGRFFAGTGLVVLGVVLMGTYIDETWGDGYVWLLLTTKVAALLFMVAGALILTSDDRRRSDGDD